MSLRSPLSAQGRDGGEENPNEDPAESPNGCLEIALLLPIFRGSILDAFKQSVIETRVKIEVGVGRKDWLLRRSGGDGELSGSLV
jgi:hypothetical protein